MIAVTQVQPCVMRQHQWTETILSLLVSLSKQALFFGSISVFCMCMKKNTLLSVITLYVYLLGIKK